MFVREVIVRSKTGQVREPVDQGRSRGIGNRRNSVPLIRKWQIDGNRSVAQCEQANVMAENRAPAISVATLENQVWIHYVCCLSSVCFSRRIGLGGRDTRKSAAAREESIRINGGNRVF